MRVFHHQPKQKQPHSYLPLLNPPPTIVGFHAVLFNVVTTRNFAHHSHVGSVSLCCGDASVFHDPLIRSPLLPSITAVIAETPGTVHQHLLRKDLQGARLKCKSETWSHSTQRSAIYLVLHQSHSEIQHRFHQLSYLMANSFIKHLMSRVKWDRKSCRKWHEYCR